MEKKRKRFGLIPRLILAISLGILVGQMSFLPEGLLRIFVTLSGLFSSFLNFIIPLMIIGFVVRGIADLTEGAGKLLGITALTAYASTLIAGTAAYLVAANFFPLFITDDLVARISSAGEGLSAIFTLPLTPMLDVTSAIVFAFIMGLSISRLRSQGRGAVLYEAFQDFDDIIVGVLQKIIIPFLPIYIFGNFLNMSYSGAVFSVLSIFWKVFLIVIGLHLLYVCAMFVIAGTYARKNPLRLIRNQISGYLTAVGTQSSAATIPVNLRCAEKNGVSEDIRNFVVPLGATIHLAGSMITIVSCGTAILLMYQMPMSLSMIIGFIAMLGIAMVAAPGAPGGAIMAALPFMPMVGITTEVLQQLIITLYITQDSFGTAANISGDNAIAVFIDRLYKKGFKKEKAHRKPLRTASVPTDR